MISASIRRFVQVLANKRPRMPVDGHGPLAGHSPELTVWSRQPPIFGGISITRRIPFYLRLTNNGPPEIRPRAPTSVTPFVSKRGIFNFCLAV